MEGVGRRASPPRRHSWACGLRLVPADAVHAPRTGRLHSFAGQLADLFHPSGELSFVELVVLVDVRGSELPESGFNPTVNDNGKLAVACDLSWWHCDLCSRLQPRPRRTL